MGKVTSVGAMSARKWEMCDHLAPEWRRVVGYPARNFKMLIWGASGNGKTSFTLALCKALTAEGRVYYNSAEEGDSPSFAAACVRAGLDQVPKEKFVVADKHDYAEMVAFLRIPRNRTQFVVIDSLQYMGLTKAQYKDLIREFPRKAFIIISWERPGGAPKGEHAQGIRYMVDIKCYVKSGVAKADSRFGATEPYKIFDANTRLTLPHEGDDANHNQPAEQLALELTGGEAVAV